MSARNSVTSLVRSAHALCRIRHGMPNKPCPAAGLCVVPAAAGYCSPPFIHYCFLCNTSRATFRSGNFTVALNKWPSLQLRHGSWVAKVAWATANQLCSALRNAIMNNALICCTTAMPVMVTTATHKATRSTCSLVVSAAALHIIPCRVIQSWPSICGKYTVHVTGAKYRTSVAGTPCPGECRFNRLFKVSTARSPVATSIGGPVDGPHGVQPVVTAWGAPCDTNGQAILCQCCQHEARALNKESFCRPAWQVC